MILPNWQACIRIIAWKLSDSMSKAAVSLLAVKGRGTACLRGCGEFPQVHSNPQGS